MPSDPVNEGPAVLEKYGMRPFAEFSITEDGRTSVSFSNDEIASCGKAIYAWIIDDQIVRIGSSRASLRSRINGHSRWIEIRLLGTCKLKNELRLGGQIEEARRWHEALMGNKVAVVWGRAGTVVETPTGALNCYLSEENSLLERHKPRFNNSHFR